MATIPTFVTWVAGTVVTAAEMNANVRDGGNFFLSVPVCELRQTVAQSIANVTGALILYDTEDIDNDGGHSTTVNSDRYTPRTAGRFQVSGGVGFVGNGTGIRDVEVAKNGAGVNGGATLMNTTVVGFTHRQTSRTMTLFANGTTDYFGILAFQNSGGALNTAVSGVEQSSMSVRWVGTT